jgi:NAD(P)-dependent dehydrogenase (short-subunit alcohol dehydrogenase family)
MLEDKFIMGMKQEKLTALITGATGGVGYSTAIRLSGLGIKVVLVSRDEIKLKKIQAEIKSIGGLSEYIVKDFLIENSVSELLEELSVRKIEPQILVNALGGPFDSEDWSDEAIYRRVYRLNTEVGIELTNKICKKISEYGWGRIIHFGSLSTKTGINSLPYITAKSALMSFVKFASNRFAKMDSKIVIAAIAPGPISVPGKYLSKIESGSPEILLNWFIENQIPTKRLVRIEEVVNLIEFLISDNGEYMNGSIIEIDGGAI